MADKKRLIDAEILNKYCLIEGDGDDEFTEGYNAAIVDVRGYVDNMPTIEAEPVKHGRWIDNGVVYTCSECNSSVPKNIFVIGCDFEGCPYCFARMDGDSE